MSRTWIAYHARGLAGDVGTILFYVGCGWAICFGLLGVICGIDALHEYATHGWQSYPPWDDGDLRGLDYALAMFLYFVPSGLMALLVGWGLRRHFGHDPNAAARRVVLVALESALGRNVNGSPGDEAAHSSSNP